MHYDNPHRCVVDDIIQLYIRYGEAAYGEDITQTEHAVQCATLAQREGASAELIVASLLHDIGHLLEEVDENHGNFKHDKVGADYLADYFPATVSEPVRLHAQAKRYLCTVETPYHDTLSEASKYSLTKQGGLMNADEVAVFQQNPHFEAAVSLRRWDDLGKDDRLSLNDISAFRELISNTLKENHGPTMA